MRLNELLRERKASILEKWFDVFIESYPPDTATFLRDQKNRFANPVGSSVSKCMENILGELMGEMNAENVCQFLDETVRIRAVQDFTPAQAVYFIFLLKKVIREAAAEEIELNNLYKELLELENRIDDLACAAFDIYMKCREKLYEIKANEARRMTFRLLQRANLISENPDQETEINESNNLKTRKEVTK